MLDCGFSPLSDITSNLQHREQPESIPILRYIHDLLPFEHHLQIISQSGHTIQVKLSTQQAGSDGLENATTLQLSRQEFVSETALCQPWTPKITVEDVEGVFISRAQMERLKHLIEDKLIQRVVTPLVDGNVREMIAEMKEGDVAAGRVLADGEELGCSFGEPPLAIGHW
jgi:hypothetical protein